MLSLSRTRLIRSVWLIGALVLSALMLATLDGLARAGEPVEQSAPPPAYPYPANCDMGTQASGALYAICMPPAGVSWNHDLLMFAHGYMAPTSTLRIPDEQLKLSDGTSIPDVANLLGYAFATTSYSTNGLAVPEGMADLVDLVTIFKQAYPALGHVYLVGASEGGLITALSIEQRPDVFDGGLATCGPIGDWNAQISYIGDFRVVFDYFFPRLMPGSPISIPQWLMDNWDAHYSTTILPVVMAPASQLSLTQLFSVTQAAYDMSSPTAYTASVSNTLQTVLWYNVFATNDGGLKLGGQPFDNWTRVYTGSLDDAALNVHVARFQAAPRALERIQALYQTSGQLRAPLVTLHTTLDEIVPYWHEPLYRDKVVARGRTPRYDQFPPSARYGHCNFTTAEVQAALSRLVSRVTTPPPMDVDVSGGYRHAARPKSAVVYTHTIANTGSLSETCLVEVASSQHWPVALVDSAHPTGTATLSLSLAHGATATVSIHLSVPASAANVVDHTVLTATVQASPDIFMVVTDATVVYEVYLPVVVR